MYTFFINDVHFVVLLTYVYHDARFRKRKIIQYITTGWQHSMHTVSSSSLVFINSGAASNFGAWSEYLEGPSQSENMNFNKKLYLLNFPLSDSII
jgi:hypothetical protein